MLIQNGAVVNAVNGWKLTALHCAAENGHTDLAKVLLQNGTDVNAVNRMKVTALHITAEKGHADIVKVLIQSDADVNAVDYTESTAVHAAVWKGHVDIAKVLILNGTNVNAVNERKFTALHYAVKKGDVPCVLQLLCLGAEINQRTIKSDYRTGLLQRINDRLKSIRAGKRMKTTLMSDEENRFMWNLSFVLTIKCRGVAAFTVYYTIRSYITYENIFMGPGYDHGDDSIWRS